MINSFDNRNQAATLEPQVWQRLRTRSSYHFRELKPILGCIAILFGIMIIRPDAIAGELAVKLSGSFPQHSDFSQNQLRDIFFVRQTVWPGGQAIRAFVFPDKHALHIRFAKEFLGVNPIDLRSAWNRMIFSGAGIPPTVVESAEEMRFKIKQTPGGIGYLEE